MKNFRWLALLLLAPALALARPTVTIEPRELTLGQPITVRVADWSLTDSDLTALAVDFLPEVVQRQRSNDGREMLELRLYPRRPGTLTVPSLPLGGRASRPMRVVVNSDPDLHVVQDLEQRQPWIRQPVRVWIEIFSRRRNPMAEIDGSWSTDWHLQPLPDQWREELREGETWYVRRLQWEAIPLRDGVLRLEPPPLRLGGRRQLPLTVLTAEVRPLPRYVPTWMPVTPITVEALPPATEVAIGEPLRRELRVSGRGLTTASLQPILAEAARIPDWRHYPAEVSEETGPDPLQRTFRIRLAGVPQMAGVAILPPLHFPYVDETGQMAVAEAPGATVTVYDPTWRTVRRTVIVMAVLLALATVVAGLRRPVQHYVARLRALRALRRARTPDAISAALQRWPSAAPAQPQTLRGWFEGLTRPSTELRKAVDELERARWRDGETDNTSLRQRLLRALRSR